MIVGLSGGYCAGKDTVARVFAANGFRVIDVDSLGHEALVARAREVIEAFGPGVEAAPGAVDRKALGRIVFADAAARATLETIVHPTMVARVREEIGRLGTDVVVNAAILHRMGLHRLCGAVVCVTSPFPLRLLRAMRRDGLRIRDALARLGAQRDICPQVKDSPVDTYTVRNRGSLRSLERGAALLAGRLRG
jgi:dephospho-CoA kinase